MWGVLLFWGASEGRLWHLLLHCVSTVSCVQSYLPEVNYSGPEWAFLLGPWADFNYHLLPVNRGDERGTASLPAACKTYSETAVHTKALFVFSVLPSPPTNAGPWRFYCLFRNKQFILSRGSHYIAATQGVLFVLFSFFYFLLRFWLLWLYNGQSGVNHKQWNIPRLPYIICLQPVRSHQ